LAPIAQDKTLRLIRVCKEDECIGIASGLSYTDKRALIPIQHTGFLDSINAIRGVAVEYKQPICMMIGLLQHDPEKTPRQSPRYGVRIVEPILDDMGIAHHLLSLDADVTKIQPAIDNAYRQSHPVAFLIGRSPS
jgi:sulfopyruvate decarboxylase TPP-binding subunit